MNRNDFAESIGIMTRNDRKNDRKRPEMTGNDRMIFLRFSHLEEWFPRKFPDFPRIFLDFPYKFLDISIKFLIFASFFIFNRIIYKVWKKKISL